MYEVSSKSGQIKVMLQMGFPGKYHIGQIMLILWDWVLKELYQLHSDSRNCHVAGCHHDFWVLVFKAPIALKKGE